MDILKKAMLAGLGAFSLTRDKAQEVINDLVKAGQLQEQESKEALDELLNKAGSMRSDLEQVIHTQLQAVQAKLNVASLAHVRKLEARLRLLEKGLHAKAGKPAAGRTKRTAKRRASR
jgi:polyhydroxyalkanoate synthesis regulator phasin